MIWVGVRKSPLVLHLQWIVPDALEMLAGGFQEKGDGGSNALGPLSMLSPLQARNFVFLLLVNFISCKPLVCNENGHCSCEFKLQNFVFAQTFFDCATNAVWLLSPRHCPQNYRLLCIMLEVLRQRILHQSLLRSGTEWEGWWTRKGVMITSIQI